MERLVIKVGSSVLIEKNKIAEERMLNLVTFIASLRSIYDVVLVTSGAVASGYIALKLDSKKQIGKKALTAAGQPILMTSYKKMFDIYGIDTAQILITEDDFDSRKRTTMFQEIVTALLDNDIIPIINENDITSTREQLFGDNDQLSANVTHSLDANLLVILSNIDGYYDKNPHEFEDAKLLKVMKNIPASALEDEHNPDTLFSIGGIATKLIAADFLLQHDKEMFLCSGFDLCTVKSFLVDKEHKKGTLFKK